MHRARILADQTTKALESLARQRPCDCHRTRERRLHRLGFKRIGDLTDKPRAPFASRFETELLTRLDQMFGRISEPMAFVVAAAGLSQHPLPDGARRHPGRPLLRSLRA